MYAEKNVAELKSLCKDRKIKGYSKLRKADLIARLEEYDLVDKLVTAEDAEEAKQGRVIHTPEQVLDAPLTPEPLPPEYEETVRWLEAQPERDEKARKRNKAKARRRALRARGFQAGPC